MKRIVVCIYLLVFLVPLAYTERLMRILVYPFENQGDASYSWLSAGMTDSVIADLGRIGSVEVITDADRKKAVKEIEFGLSDLADEKGAARVGKLTGADIIFTGSYTVAGGRVRVVAKFVNVESGSVVKSIKLDGTVENIFDLQDKIVFALMDESQTVKVADVKKAVITDNERSRIETKQRPKLTAYEYYAKGLEIRNTDPSGALRLFSEALAVEPEYVDALLQAGYTAGRTLNRFAEGLVYLEKAAALLKKLNQSETADYAALLMNMGTVYDEKGELDRALEYYGGSRDIRDRLGLQNTAGYGHLLYNIAGVYERKGQKEAAGRLYRKAYETYQHAGYTGAWKDNARKNAERLGY
jgi:TolB-like protein